jgi:sarcosine oxidase/L-pipecolate oxidase
MLIAVKVQISKPLCMLFNKSLHQNILPTDWKLSHVIPLFKVGDKSFPSNYRPVSLLSCVSKLLEKIVLNISLIIYREINYCVNFSQVFYQVDLLPINL